MKGQVENFYFEQSLDGVNSKNNKKNIISALEVLELLAVCSHYLWMK